MADLCDDGRFELIEKYKLMLIESTNINNSEDELKVLDTILFRFWQMGWLDKLEQPTAPQWIPCSERLPKKDGRYQVTRYDYVTNTGFIDILWYEENLWWNRHSTGDYAVIAWMPLPEPWKGE